MYVYEFVCLWICMSKNLYVYEFLCLWIVVPMNLNVYEFECLWISMSRNCYANKLLCEWICMYMYNVYELLCQRIFVSLRCLVDKIYQYLLIWFGRKLLNQIVLLLPIVVYVKVHISTKTWDLLGESLAYLQINIKYMLLRISLSNITKIIYLYLKKI